MLGEKIGEDSGKITGQRVLPSTGAGPRVETSFTAQGTLLGVANVNMGTYEATMRADGTLIGEGQGIVMGKDGSSATWRGQGVGTMKADGSIAYRGAVYYTSASPKFTRLNSVAVVYEHDVDAAGNSTGKVYEWK